MPKIVAKLKTGGQQLTVTGRVRFQLTQAERDKIQACVEKLQTSGGAPATPRGGNGAGGGRLGGGGGGGRARGFDRGAFAKCLPAQVRNYRADDHDATADDPADRRPAPDQHQELELLDRRRRPEAAGDRRSSPRRCSRSGRFLTGGDEALVAGAYAGRQGLKLGSTLDLNGTKLKVVGLVKPPLGGQTADIYIPLAKLQTLAGQGTLANVVLVRATSGTSVAAVQKEIEQKYPNAQVASSAGRHLGDQRLARRRVEPVAPPRRRPCDPRRPGRVPPRRAAHPLLGREARARARDAEGARLDAAEGRATGHGRVARAGRRRRPARDRGRRARSRPRSAPSGRR